MFSSLCKQITAQRKCEAENIIKTAEEKEYDYKDLVIALFISIGGRGKRLSYKIQRTWTSETFQLETVVLPCSVHYKKHFCDSQRKSNTTNQALLLPSSPLM